MEPPLISALLRGKRYVNEFFGEDTTDETVAELLPPQFNAIMKEVAEYNIPMTRTVTGEYEIYGMLFKEVTDA